MAAFAPLSRIASACGGTNGTRRNVPASPPCRSPVHMLESVADIGPSLAEDATLALELEVQERARLRDLEDGERRHEAERGGDTRRRPDGDLPGVRRDVDEHQQGGDRQR